MTVSILDDINQLTRAAAGAHLPVTRAGAVLRTDSLPVLMLSRFPESPVGRLVPLARWMSRRIMTAVYGVEIGKDVELGAGVYFVHTVGVVVGGNAVIGERVRFYGSNTVGTARDNGYPVVEDDVQIGCGARILGPVRVGARSIIGANAVVLTDIPPDSVVVGIPGRVVATRPQMHSVQVAA